jgi:uncharacterized membrane protein YdjX (TVP38/TMEM64 family)
LLLSLSPFPPIFAVSRSLSSQNDLALLQSLGTVTIRSLKQTDAPFILNHHEHFPPSTKRSPAANLWKWAFLLFIASALVVLSRTVDVGSLFHRTLDGIEQAGFWGMVLFVLVYTLATVLLIPGSILTLGAGAVYGLWKGALLISFASTLGATAAFLIGRHLARDRVTRRLGSFPRFAVVDRAVAKEGWKIIGLTRLSPAFPFTLLNYAFGLTKVSLPSYVLASWIGMMPGTLMYVYIGTLAGASIGTRTRTPAEWTLYAVGLAATVAVTVMVTRIAKKALAEKTSDPPPTARPDADPPR